MVRPRSRAAEVVQTKVYRRVPLLKGVEAGVLGLAAGALTCASLTGSPELTPMTLATNWVLASKLERPDSNRERNLGLASSAATAAASLVAPGWAGAAVLAQGVGLGLRAACTTRAPEVPTIAPQTLSSLMLAKTPYPSPQAMQNSLGLEGSLRLAGEVYHDQLKPQHLLGLDLFYDIRQESGSARRLAEDCLGAPFPGKVYSFRQNRMDGTFGAASGANLALSQETLGWKNQVSQWFVVGHEFSHIQHRDLSLQLGAQGLKAMPTQWSARQIDKALVPLRHDCELRADREGADLALSKGADRDEVYLSAYELLAHSKASSLHPGGKRRIEALIAHLYGEGEQRAQEGGPGQVI